MRDDADKSRLLLELNNALISQLDLEELLRSIFDLVKQVFDQTIAATLSIHDPKTNELRIHLLHSDDPDLFREGMGPLPRRHAQRCGLFEAPNRSN